MKDFEIKKYLYIDENTINSYISQIYEGLLTDMKLTKDSASTIENEKSESITDKGAILKGSLHFISAETSLKDKMVSDSIKESLSNYNSKSIRKTYDAYLKINKFLDTVNISSNPNESSKIIEINEDLQFINFNKLKTILKDKCFMGNSGLKRNRKQKRKDKNNNDENLTIEQIIDMLDLISKLLPTDTIFYNDNYIIPIIEENLLCKPKQISYNFNNDMTVVGELMGSIDTINSFDLKKGALAGIETQMNVITAEVFKSALGLDINKISILKPIIIYSKTSAQTNHHSLDDY
ncbi:DUF6414 family protein [Anaerococcus vaginalis]|uniref:DUF6414 family protein n=1 Tax=Anaerococcus vaginalis TaxID=33037 RepID=UPI00242BE22F|nr:hypothetical protein [Anaerococcus vaginalis]MDD7766305.1 hypothetical protein [Anaerococcus vaginalis]